LSYSKSLECAKLLVGAGVDVNCRNAKDNTPLMVAAALGHYNILEFLIAQPNIEINAQVLHISIVHMDHKPFYC
jgi:ankyrin repeat protein